MDSKFPLVSVVIPTYNRCQFVQAAIDSVLAQTYPCYELLVVDDGSTDGTGDILRAKYGERIVYTWQANQGESAARNYGLSIANGKYVAFLDSDDLWLPEKLSRQVPVLENNPEIGAIFCQAWHIDGDGQRVEQLPLGFNSVSADLELNTLLMRNRIPAGASTCLIRSSIFEKVGVFPLDIHYGEDWDLWLRISANFSIILIPEPLASYRRHGESQRFFTNAKRIDDILADRLVMLQRCANRFPEKIHKQSYDKAIANQYFTASLANFLLNDVRRGKERLNKAVELFPNLWRDKNDFAEQINIFALGYSVDQKGNFSPDRCLSFIDNLCGNLPESLDRRGWIQLTKGKVIRDIGFWKCSHGNRMESVRLIFRSILLAPQLMDLAVLALFAEFILGRSIVNRLRARRHKGLRSA